MELETIIGLEVHVQLKTATKVFCGCATTFGSQPNTQTCPVCLGFPGSLPVVNEKALEYATTVALAFNCSVQEIIKFDRKNYFYPDLPKNYQISQFDMPVGLNGSIACEQPDGTQKSVRIKRVHLEEDAGKLIHQEGAGQSLVDFNRCGVPLLEIVSEPDIYSPQEAYDYLRDLRLILLYLGVSDCDMEKGSLRCDANVSLRPKGQHALGTKVEVKNMNSLKWVRLALEYEVKRQSKILGEGNTITQETRLWDEKNQATQTMRSKEEAHDYRYFPDPDLVPFTLRSDFIDRLKEQLPEAPRQKKARFVEKLGLSSKETDILISDKELCGFFEACLKDFSDAKKLYNWLTGSVLAYLNDRRTSLAELKLRPGDLITLIQAVTEGTLSNLAAKEVFFCMLDEKKPMEVIIREKGLSQVSDEGQLDALIDKVVADNAKSVNDFLSGKENALMFLIGQTMKISKGKANPKVIKEMMMRRLQK